MIRHNLLLFYRNFRQFKSTFFINLLGLSTGLASVIMIYLWANDELSFDRFHENTARIYQVMDNENSDGTIKTTGHTQDFLGTLLKEEMPEVEYGATTTPRDFFPSFVLHAGNDYVKGTVKFADEDFFNIFSYNIIEGNADHILSNEISVAISSSLSKRLFGTTENAIGKTFEWQAMTLKQTVEVSGVFNDVPQNASEQFDFVLPMKVLLKLIGSKGERDWNNITPFHNYVLLREDADVAALNDRIKNIIQDRTGKPSTRTFFLQPYGDLYLHGRFENGISTGGRIEYVRLFVAIALVILVIACVNFINLFTAKASRKIKEVGIKKAIGAQRKTLIRQYLGESVLMSVISLLIALLLVQLALPQFGEITGKNLFLTFDTKSIVVISIITLTTGLLAGVYPAIYISGFQPAKILRGQLSSSPGESWTRKGLVVFQFTLSIIFIVCVLVLHQQVRYIQTRDLGFSKDNVIFFESEGRVPATSATFISEINNIPGVINASGMLGNIINVSSGMPGGGTPDRGAWKGKEIILSNTAVNYGLLETLGIKLKAGRTFSEDFPADRNKIILNESAVNLLDLDDPIGKFFNDKEIIGVVKDFHSQSAHEMIQPLLFRLEPDASTTIMVKIESGNEKETIAAIENFYKTYNPGYAFSYKFLEDQYRAQYAGEAKVGTLSKYFASLAIIISCLGLFGLAVFTAERRKKEVSIRKVLGSTQLEIVSLMSRDFTRMVFVSIVIGLPVSFMITSWWLEGFAYKIEISWWYFAVSAMLVILLTWLTVGAQTIKVARVNPADSLRSE
jgi:putative ABC transport system permease protein